MVKLLPLILLAGCTTWGSGKQELQSTFNVCIFSSCSAVARPTAAQGGSNVDADGATKQDATPTNTATVPVIGNAGGALSPLK